MDILERLKADTGAAMKAGDRERVSALRLVTSQVQQAQKESPDGADLVGVLQRERKRRLESAQTYRDAGRADLAEGEEHEARVIEEYLPAQLSDDELHALVGDVVAEVGATSPRDMGKVMSAVMPRVEGRADGKRVSQVVREKLSA